MVSTGLCLALEAVQKVLSTDSAASRVDENRRFLNLNMGEIAFRPTFWTASQSKGDEG